MCVKMTFANVFQIEITRTAKEADQPFMGISEENISHQGAYLSLICQSHPHDKLKKVIRNREKLDAK